MPPGQSVRRWRRQGSLYGYLGGVVLLLAGLVGLPSADLALAQAELISSRGSDQDPQLWLERYNAALKQLPPLPNLQYRQQVRVEGSQTFTATLDVLRRRDGSWQAWVAEGDRVRLLDSRQLEAVNQSDLLKCIPCT